MDNGLKKLVLETLDRGYLMSLATQDSAGLWACDVIYIHDDDLNIYWMSDPNARHSRSLEFDNNIAGTITISNSAGEDNLGVQFLGVAEKLAGARFDLIVKHFLKRKKIVPPSSANLEAILDGDLWYKLTPKFFDIICEERWGHDKKKLEI